MSYQIVQNPTSIADIFGVLAQELTTNGYTVERTSEVVGAETCISWTDGSGLWFHVDWDSVDIMYTGISTGYVTGVLGRNQSGAKHILYSYTGDRGNGRIEGGYRDINPTTIIVTDDLVYLKQDYSTQVKPAFQFSKSYFYSKGHNWINSASRILADMRTPSYKYSITELIDATKIIGSSGVYTIRFYTDIVFFDGSIVTRLNGEVYSDNLFNNSYLSGVQSNFLDKMLVNEYYSTLAKPLRLYISGQPFAKLNDRILLGRNENLLDNQIVNIAGKNYIKTYSPKVKPLYLRSNYIKEAVLIRYD